jgi:predicted regulator of Ras-like GTPase activity (Roadblock/LC7/MglB family)
MEISNFRLESDEYNKIVRILSSLAEKGGFTSVFLINRNGHKIAHHGESETVDEQALSSLAASNLASTYGLAQLLGEGEFERIYHRGREKCILICPAGEFALLLFVIPVDNDRPMMIGNLKPAVLVLEDVLKKTSREKAIGT